VLAAGLAVGIGLPFSSYVASSYWQDQDGPWVLVGRAVVAALAGGWVVLTALVIQGVLKGKPKGAEQNRWGINLQGVRCPKCARSMPTFRVPDGWQQILWGGWTCRHCGCRMDKWGRAVEEACSRR
jgi:hypothetical protein